MHSDYASNIYTRQFPIITNPTYENRNQIIDSIIRIHNSTMNTTIFNIDPNKLESKTVNDGKINHSYKD